MPDRVLIVDDDQALRESLELVLASEGGKLQATIQADQIAPSYMVVPRDTSTVLDLNQPVTRVEVAKPEVAGVTVLSPRQLLRPLPQRPLPLRQRLQLLRLLKLSLRRLQPAAVKCRPKFG